MNTFDEEKALREIAEASVDALGRQVLDELAAFHKKPDACKPDTMGLDARVQDMRRRADHAPRRVPWLFRAAALLAACAVAAIALPYFMRDDTGASPSDAASPAAPGHAAGPASESADAPGAAVPVTFTLGGRYAVAEVELDRGQTVCRIDDTMGDDIVLTMEYADQSPDYAELSEYTVNGYTVYGAYEADYSVLLFEKDGVLYRLTCRYDLNTLLDVSKYILI